ncbi:MAG: Uncharacterised protein [SAR116 cluster bacterium]|nr:MAG: Uncharacterised protein [SAR116 cluster bacterium]
MIIFNNATPIAAAFKQAADRLPDDAGAYRWDYNCRQASRRCKAAE